MENFHCSTDDVVGFLKAKIGGVLVPLMLGLFALLCVCPAVCLGRYLCQLCGGSKMRPGGWCGGGVEWDSETVALRRKAYSTTEILLCKAGVIVVLAVVAVAAALSFVGAGALEGGFAAVAGGPEAALTWAIDEAHKALMELPLQFRQDSAIATVINAFESYRKSLHTTLSGDLISHTKSVTGVLGFAGVVPMLVALLVVAAAFFNTRAYLPPCGAGLAFCMILVFGATASLYATARLPVAVVCSEFQAQRERRPGIFQWGLKPRCDEYNPFRGITAEINRVVPAVAARACGALLDLCHNADAAPSAGSGPVPSGSGPALLASDEGAGSVASADGAGGSSSGGSVPSGPVTDPARPFMCADVGPAALCKTLDDIVARRSAMTLRSTALCPALDGHTCNAVSCGKRCVDPQARAVATNSTIDIFAIAQAEDVVTRYAKDYGDCDTFFDKLLTFAPVCDLDGGLGKLFAGALICVGAFIAAVPIYFAGAKRFLPLDPRMRGGQKEVNFDDAGLDSSNLVPLRVVDLSEGGEGSPHRRRSSTYDDGLVRIASAASLPRGSSFTGGARQSSMRSAANAVLAANAFQRRQSRRRSQMGDAVAVAGGAPVPAVLAQEDGDAEEADL